MSGHKVGFCQFFFFSNVYIIMMNYVSCDLDKFRVDVLIFASCVIHRPLARFCGCMHYPQNYFVAPMDVARVNEDQQQKFANIHI